MAKDYLAIQGSSVPSEHVFSAAGLDKTLLCNCMKANLFEALQILKSAYKDGLLSAMEEAERFAQQLRDMDAELAANSAIYTSLNVFFWPSAHAQDTLVCYPPLQCILMQFLYS
jgi:hypothetical protein